MTSPAELTSMPMFTSGSSEGEIAETPSFRARSSRRRTRSSTCSESKRARYASVRAWAESLRIESAKLLLC